MENRKIVSQACKLIRGEDQDWDGALLGHIPPEIAAQFRAKCVAYVVRQAITQGFADELREISKSLPASADWREVFEIYELRHPELA